MWGYRHHTQQKRLVEQGAQPRGEHCMGRPCGYPQVSVGLLQDKETGGAMSPEGGVRTLGSHQDRCQFTIQKNFLKTTSILGW